MYKSVGWPAGRSLRIRVPDEQVFGIAASVPERSASPLPPAAVAVETAVIWPYPFTVITGICVELPKLPVFAFTVARSRSVR